MSLQDRLYNYEVAPPAKTWEQVAAALDESELANKFPSTLQEMEVTPPPAAWDRISDTLESPVVSMPARRRTMPVLRYAAAAVVIGAIAFGIFRWSGKSSTTAGIATNAAAVSDSGTTFPNSAAGNATALSDTVTLTADIARVQQKKTLAQVGQQSASSTTHKAENTVSRNRSIASAIYRYDDHIPNVSDRYITLMTPDGNFIRMSKKWSNMVCCISGEEQDADCKDQLKKWQEKIAHSSTNSANFMDILSLVNSLDEGVEL